MQRIAYLVTRSDTIGGSHIHVRDIGVAMMNKGYDVDILIGGNGPIIEEFKEAGLNVTKIPSLVRNLSPFKDIRAYFEIKNILQNIKPDIVSTHSSKAGFLGRLAAKYLEIPVLFTAHGWSFTTGKNRFRQALYRTLERVVAPFTDLIITVSEYDRQLALKHLQISEADVVTIHNGMRDIDSAFLADIKDENPVPIVMVARFDDQKNHSELLKAIHDIENIHLHFVGDGPLMEEIKMEAKDLGLLQSITFWGRVQSVDKILSEGQIFTLISNWEGFPRSTLEGMRAGLPTIVSDVGGSAEAVVEGKTGNIVQKGDVKKLHRDIKDLVKDVEKRKKMGAAARSRYEKYFTFEKMFEKTRKVYQEILNSDLKGK